MRPVSDLKRRVAPFEVITEMVPAGDQPRAIAEMERRLESGAKDTVLLGATGTGKTATVAWLAERLQRPTLVMLPNKTLAAQFANELREMLPHNAVEYFVSYYDYYQPEAYVPQTDTYIEKDSSINDEVDRLRHSATNSLLTRRDTIVVASVSCIYAWISVERFPRGAGPSGGFRRNTAGATVLTLGFNWYLNAWVRFQFDWEHHFFDNAIPLLTRPAPFNYVKENDAFAGRFQIIF